MSLMGLDASRPGRDDGVLASSRKSLTIMH
jgi:hypothetical protein